MNSLAVIGICVAVAVIAAAAAGIFIFIRSRRKHDEGTGTGTAVSTSPSGLSDTSGDAGTESEPAAGPAPSEAGVPSAEGSHAPAGLLSGLLQAVKPAADAMSLNPNSPGWSACVPGLLKPATRLAGHCSPSCRRIR